MAEHAAPTEPPVTQTQPVGLAEVVRMIVLALVSAGWITVDDATVNTIVSVIGVAISIGLTWWTGRKVTPVAKPRTDEGVPLVPAPPGPTPGQP